MNQPSIQSGQNRTTGFRWLDADAYLFDIDGTLLNTRDFVHWDALHQAMLEAYSVETTIEGIAYHGKTDLGILRAALARMGILDGKFEANLSAALAVICREVAANAGSIVAEICPAIPDVLSLLHGADKLLGVASGNLESVGWQKIKAAGLENFFSFGYFSDHCEMRADIFRNAVNEARRRLGDHASVCFVGDTAEDVRAARAAGGQVIAVCTGVSNQQELSLLQPDLCVASCVELLKLR